MPNYCLGICITCRHRSYCQSLQNGLRAQRPVWDCNEYEHNDSDAADAVSAAYRVRSTDGEYLSHGTNEDRSIGLCINCDQRRSCMLPIAEGGVWHCGEYC